MTSGPCFPPPSPRLPPGTVEAAVRHAHALREQALDDAVDRIAGFLRRLVHRQDRRAVREAPCLS